MQRSARKRLPGWSAWLLVGWLGSTASAQTGATPVPDQTSPAAPETLTEKAKATLGMSPAVACLRVDGLDRYTPLPDATLTNADKLKVYFRPLNFKVETDTKNRSPFRAKFSEDGRIRRKGEKTVLAREDKLLEYETRFDLADYQIFLVNTIGLENLPPGDYEFDIILHDMIDGEVTAKQTLPFKIVSTEAQAAAKPTTAATPPTKPKKATNPGRSPRRPG